eukprot:scaffold16235_cov50-Phaeocystis_antarctica.AAC.4
MSALKFCKSAMSLLMSVMAETSQSAMGPYVAVAAVASSLNTWTATFREAVLVKVPGGCGGEGGDDGGWNCTTKDPVLCLGPLAKENLCSKPGAAHCAPFQPSPYESVMFRVHAAPSATANGKLEVYGAPPLSVVPSEQLRLQPTSSGYDPLEQVIAEEMVGDNGGESGGDGGDGGDGGGGGGCGGEGGDDGGWNCTTKDPVLCLGPLAKENLCPKPGAAHSAPFQPSAYESVMFRVHVAPSTTANGTLEVYGAPPLSVVSSEQLRLQPTSFGYDPPEQVIAEEMVGGDSGAGEGGGEGGEGGEGGGGGAFGGEGGEGGGGASGGASWWMATSVSVHAELQYARHVARPCGGEDESSELMRAQ